MSIFYISAKSMPENPILDKAALVYMMFGAINQQPLDKSHNAICRQ